MLLRIQRNILFLCVPSCLFWSVGFISSTSGYISLVSFFILLLLLLYVLHLFVLCCSSVSGLNGDKNKGPCFNEKHFTSSARRDSHHITCHYALLCILATCDLSGSVELGRSVLPHLAWFLCARIQQSNRFPLTLCTSYPPALISRNYSDFNDNCRRFICKYFSLERTDR